MTQHDSQCSDREKSPADDDPGADRESDPRIARQQPKRQTRDRERRDEALKRPRTKLPHAPNVTNRKQPPEQLDRERYRDECSEKGRHAMRSSASTRTRPSAA